MYKVDIVILGYFNEAISISLMCSWVVFGRDLICCEQVVEMVEITDREWKILLHEYLLT